VIAGIIGTKKYYDLWGNIVNVVNRMESTGIAGRVHTSSSMYMVFFHCHFGAYVCLAFEGQIQI
jgi:hypothetical protein